MQHDIEGFGFFRSCGILLCMTVVHAQTAESVRADVWLWAARFFKTRRLCREAIDGGKVVLNGAHCKPAKAVKVGDMLRITRGVERFEIAVLGLADRRGPASVAQALYQETDASKSARESERDARRLSAMTTPMPQRRPGKQDRRRLRAFKERGE